jgi:outer membrane protein, multidrug efflux system
VRRAKWLLVPVLALAGCATTPPLEVPTPTASAEFKHGAAWHAVQPGDHLPRGEWWRDFGDPQLDALISRIDATSPTLAAAVARYDRAAATARMNRSGLLPSIDARGAVSREGRADGQSISQYVLGAALGYEIDLWGRVRSEVRAGNADAAAAAADIQSVGLSLRAAVADHYMRLRGLDAQLKLLERTVATYRRADELIRIRHEGGLASGIDRSRSQTQLSNARARREALVAERASTENAIAVLIGDVPSQFSIPVADAIPVLPAVTAGVPSALLERRPDVAQAERRLIAANARIGASRAALFPVVQLGLAGGVQATGASILSAPTSYWALGPLAAMFDIFDGGRRRAQVDVRRAEYREIAAQYRDTVLDAFREVEDALAVSTSLAAQERERHTAAEAAQRSEALALDRYQDGAADYLEVLTAQTAALDAQQALIDVVVARRRAAIAMVRALGGAPDTMTVPSAGSVPVAQR